MHRTKVDTMPLMCESYVHGFRGGAASAAASHTPHMRLVSFFLCLMVIIVSRWTEMGLLRRQQANARDEV